MYLYAKKKESTDALERWPCMLLSQTGNTKNVCIPTRLDNAGREERTF